MDKVWSGTIVTENAISRTLVKVRKVLDDDPKQPKFIITVPKKGYRMVAEFIATDNATLTNGTDESANEPNEKVAPEINSKVLTENSTNNNDSIDKDTNKVTTSKKTKVIQATVMLLSIIAIFLTWQWLTNSTVVITTKQIKALTREVAVELHPSVSPDLKKIAYTKKQQDKRSYINIEDLKTHNKQSISHPRATLSKQVWSPTTNKLAFLYQHNHVCNIFWANLSDIKNKDSWQKISECGTDSSPQFVFSVDGQYLYFNDRQSNSNGYQVFRVDLSTLKKDIVNQPITSGLGNYSFDISPNGKRLVLLNSEFSPQTHIYTLNIETSLLTKTAQLPYLMRSARWAHDNSTIVHPSPHPAYELWQSSLDGNKLSVFASNTSRIKQHTRINNGEDFAFVSYLRNRDIFYQENSEVYRSDNEPTIQALDNSSVMDYLPTLANNSKQYAFVSKRSTTAEVYLSTLDKNEAQAQQLTFFNNPVKIYHLAFSPNDKQLLIQADNQLFIVNLSNLAIEKLPINNTSINGASWQDDQNLLFSTIKNNDWEFMKYNITQQKTKIFTGYQGGIFSASDKSYYLLADESGQVTKFDPISKTALPINLTCIPSFKDRQLNLVATATGLACLANKNDKALSHYAFKTQQVETLPNLPKTIDFDANATGFIYTKMTRSVADVMRTSTK